MPVEKQAKRAAAKAKANPRGQEANVVATRFENDKNEQEKGVHVLNISLTASFQLHLLRERSARLLARPTALDMQLGI